MTHFQWHAQEIARLKARPRATVLILKLRDLLLDLDYCAATNRDLLHEVMSATNHGFEAVKMLREMFSFPRPSLLSTEAENALAAIEANNRFTTEKRP